MFIDFVTFGKYGLFIWPAFIFTFVSCLCLYIKTKKELDREEKMFIKAFEQPQIIVVDKRRENKKEVLLGSKIQSS